MTHPLFRSGLLALSLLALSACKTGYNKIYASPDGDDIPAPDCATGPANTSASQNTRNVFNMLASLTCGEAERDGVVMGQSAGFGNQIAGDVNDFRSYARLVDGFRTTANLAHTPALVAIDYEHDRRYSLTELATANDILTEHWQAGGLVSVSWMPLNIWRNNALDPHATGNHLELLHSTDVDLEALVTQGHPRHEQWRAKLNHVAEALKQLQANNVTVLWRPLPEMNNDSYWWGTRASYRSNNPDSATLYINLWRDMYRYLTVEHQLNNLLWVYSPAEGGPVPSGNTAPTDAPVGWAYPGNAYVDVVGAIVRDDQLIIPDYQALLDFGKPLGLAEYGPLPADQGGNYTHDGSFDVSLYADRLEGRYAYVSYWTSWHSYNLRDYNSDLAPSAQSLQALIDNPRYIEELVNRRYILSRERVRDNNLRDRPTTPSSSASSSRASSSSSSGGF